MKKEKKQKDNHFPWMLGLNGEVVSKFYPDNALADFIFLSAQDPLAGLIEKIEKYKGEQVWTQEQLEEKCFQIRNNLREGKISNVEIRFDKMIQLSQNSILNMGITIFKICIYGQSEADYFYIREGEKLNARVFLGENIWGILAIVDEKGKEHFIRLEEFHMLSLPESENPPKSIVSAQDIYESIQKEVGLMTSFFWLTGNVYTSCIMGANLLPIKSLLLSEYLKSE